MAVLVIQPLLEDGIGFVQAPGLRQLLYGLLMTVQRGVGLQFLDPAVPGQRVVELVSAVDRGDLPAAEQGDGFIDVALALADRREQAEHCVGIEAAAALRALAAVSSARIRSANSAAAYSSRPATEATSTKAVASTQSWMCGTSRSNASPARPCRASSLV